MTVLLQSVLTVTCYNQHFLISILPTVNCKSAFYPLPPDVYDSSIRIWLLQQKHINSSKRQFHQTHIIVDMDASLNKRISCHVSSINCRTLVASITTRPII